jgi:hypothetical protein
VIRRLQSHVSVQQATLTSLTEFYLAESAVAKEAKFSAKVNFNPKVFTIEAGGEVSVTSTITNKQTNTYVSHRWCYVLPIEKFLAVSRPKLTTDTLKTFG